MKPIEVKIVGYSNQTSQEACSALLDMERWPEFEGYSILPGIESAKIEKQMPGMVGTRIRVKNLDGSSHVEEIVEWDDTSQVALRFQEFDSPLKTLASHFVERWQFRNSERGLEITRTINMYPMNIFAWVMLMPISVLMKKALEKNLAATHSSSSRTQSNST